MKSTDICTKGTVMTAIVMTATVTLLMSIRPIVTKSTTMATGTATTPTPNSGHLLTSLTQRKSTNK